MSSVLETQKTTPVTEVIQNGQVLNARLISVGEYDQMIAHGILTAEDKVELLNGVIIEKMPKGIKHAALNDLISNLFRERLGNKAIVRNQNPVVLNDFSEPEPDIALVKPPLKTYFERHPTPEDIFLIVEISDTTLGRDRFAKGLAYAKAGIRQYLVINIQDQTIEDYREPAEDGYQSKQTHHTGQSFKLVAFPEFEIKVEEILPSE